MKFKAILMSLLLWTTMKEKDNQVELSEDERAKLNADIGEADASLLISQVNAELAGVKTAKEELAEAKKELDVKSKESETDKSTLADLTKKIGDLSTKVSAQDALIRKLSDEPETNLGQFRGSAEEILGKVFEVGGKLLGLEAGASGNLWAVEKPWNAAALSGAKGSTTDFRSSAAIETLNNDMLDFVTAYPEKIDQMFAQNFDLPEFWPRVTGVLDRMMSATISVGEVTQPRKARWAPKGDVVIKPEEMKVQPAQIDLQFNYWEMQKIETNWLRGYNREGSQAYKMTFIEYLMTFFLAKARQEDADVLIRGVHVATPESYDPAVTGRAVSYLNRNDGLLKQVFDAKENGKYRPFNLGVYNYANSVDYIDGLIGQLPDSVKNEQLQLITAPSKLLDYKRRYEELFGGNNNYTGYPETPKDYSNIKFVALKQLEGSDVMMITTLDNIKILEYKPEEKALITFEKFLRDVYAFGDYRIGLGINHIGLAVPASDPMATVKQAIWTNNVPLFSPNFFSTAYDDTTGTLEVRHNRVKPDNGFSTDITKITGEVGKILIIRGDASMATVVNVKNNADLLLTADFSLKTGGDLTLIRTNAGKWKEVSRTTGPAVAPTSVEFTTASIAYKANEYLYTGAAAVTLTGITGGTEGNTVRLYGGADAGHALTVADVVGNIEVNSNAVLDSNAKYIDLVYVNGVWTEMGRG